MDLSNCRTKVAASYNILRSQMPMFLEPLQENEDDSESSSQTSMLSLFEDDAKELIMRKQSAWQDERTKMTKEQEITALKDLQEAEHKYLSSHSSFNTLPEMEIHEILVHRFRRRLNEGLPLAELPQQPPDTRLSKRPGGVITVILFRLGS